MSEWRQLIDLLPSVAEALERRQPVVALESAVISHGLPPPTGRETAQALEATVRQEGAVAATIAVIEGRIKVGLTEPMLAHLEHDGAMKIAARDLSVALAQGASGGTTVSATVAVAHHMGIPVLSTGGIGGVHLGASESWDVSADLHALATHPVAVVCAGAKAICDVGRTLEVLDSIGVTVVAYRTNRFPGFYTLDSGYAAPHRIETPREAARLLGAKRALREQSGLLVANPIPAAHALPKSQVQEAVTRAIERAAAEGIRGGELTPYLLAALAEASGGETVRANLALLRANATLAAQIARAWREGGEDWLSR